MQKFISTMTGSYCLKNSWLLIDSFHFCFCFEQVNSFNVYLLASTYLLRNLSKLVLKSLA